MPAIRAAGSFAKSRVLGLQLKRVVLVFVVNLWRLSY